MRRLARPLATGLRQTLISPSHKALIPSTGPGVVVLGSDLLPVTMTPLAQQWLAQVYPDWRQEQRLLLPTVSALVARLEAREQTPLPERWAPRVRIRSLKGNWFVLQVERLAISPAPGMIALTIQPALPTQMLPLFLQVFALTRRERELTAFVFQGLSTAEIAAELHISSYTVQEHVRASAGHLLIRIHSSLSRGLGRVPFRRAINAISFGLIIRCKKLAQSCCFPKDENTSPD